MIWSISTHRMWQRCQQQFFFHTLMAHARARDPLRQRAHMYKQAQQLAQWPGTIVHYAIEQWVLPALRQGMWPDEDTIIAQALELTNRQFAFSQSGQYRRTTRSKAGDVYCMLEPHVSGETNAAHILDEAHSTITIALHNLLHSARMRNFLLERTWYQAERMLHFTVDGTTVRAKPDLLMPAQQGGHLDVLDWKVTTTSSSYHLQVGVYALAVRNNPLFAPSAERGLTGYVVNLLAPDPAVALDHPHVVDADILVGIENMVYESIDQIRALTGGRPYTQQDRERFEYARRTGTCALCSFRALCVELNNESPAQHFSTRQSEPTQLALPLS